MTPAARLAAAIDLAAEVEDALVRRGPPADVLVQRFFRKRRYAGSHDRAAVTDMLYRLLRRRGELVWRLTSVEAPVSARLLILLLARLQGDVTAAMFEGSYAAPAPDRSERELLDRAAALDAPPPWARCNVPSWLHERLSARFGAALADEMAMLAGRAPTDLRINRARTTREAALAALADAGIGADPTPFSPLGLRIADAPDLSRLPLVAAGAVEVQDEAAQIAVLIAAAAPGEQVVDLCAGAGGKALALADSMNNRGQIYAFDLDRRRLGELKRRADRAGVHNIQIHRLTSGEDKRALQLARLEGRMDLVVVDVPCTGSGVWRRNPELRWRFDEAALAEMTARQCVLLEEGLRLARDGGRVAYMSCSILAEENEEVVRRVLKGNPAWRLLDLRERALDAGLGGLPATAAGPPEMLQLTPARHGTDGFFVAMLAK